MSSTFTISTYFSIINNLIYEVNISIMRFYGGIGVVAAQQVVALLAGVRSPYVSQKKSQIYPHFKAVDKVNDTAIIINEDYEYEEFTAHIRRLKFSAVFML